MGIVNVTPDSFSDGGLFLDPERAIAHGRELAEAGADLLDVGGESTRPGAEAVTAEVELERTAPVVAALAGADGPGVPVSIDTSKAAVAEAALASGAAIVNDVTALRADPELAGVCARSRCTVILMHMQGTPRTMQDDPRYDDVVDDVRAFLAERIEAAVAAGIDERDIWVDPGIGFGKTVEHNLELLRRLGELRALGRPIVDRHLAQALPRRAHRPRGRRTARRHDRLERARARRRRRRVQGPRRRRAAPGARRRRGPALGRRLARRRTRLSAPRAKRPTEVRCARGSARRARVDRPRRAPRPLDLHPPRGHRSRAGDRPAAGDRRLLRRPRLRRGAHRPARGHDRLRGGRRHRRPRGDRAQLPDARAARRGDRRAADGALRLRLGPGAGGEARAAAAGGDRGGRGRGRARARRRRPRRGRRARGD